MIVNILANYLCLALSLSRLSCPHETSASWSVAAMNGSGIFTRRQDFSSFNSLPRHKLNSYHIKKRLVKECTICHDDFGYHMHTPKHILEDTSEEFNEIMATA
ncbi:hypothetical protein M8J75_015215 [Diaphorina citri]|nr:hypothetical protein M8J75_015215 [Diaphorina citri]